MDTYVLTWNETRRIEIKADSERDAIIEWEDTDDHVTTLVATDLDSLTVVKKEE